MKIDARKYISLLLALCMVVSILPATALAAGADDDHGEHSGWTELTSDIIQGGTLNGGNYYLTSDLNAGTKQIKVTGTVNLCLNGHTYTGEATDGVLRVGSGGTLNIYDCSSDGSGMIQSTGGHNPIFLHSGGVCNLYSGTIKSNVTAVVIDDNELYGNAGYEGGALNSNGSTFTMYGGTVTSTSTGNQGINVNPNLTNASVIIEGGTVHSGRYAINAASGTVTLSGDLDISGDTAGIYLRNDAKIIPANLTGGEVGVDMETPGVFTSDQGANYQQYFYSDKANYVVIKSGDELALGSESSNLHKHYVCGNDNCTDTNHGSEVTFAPLSSLSSTIGQGNYYLTKNLTNDTGDHITVSGDVTLCLNGRTLDLNGKHIIVPTGSSLTLCDCGSGGTITGQDCIYGNDDGNGSVYVLGGSFIMYSGSISGNKAYSGGGVNVNGGSFTMYGGTISGNTAQLGGGVSVISGSFTMHGGTISNNKASTNGCGGVYVANGGIFTMYDGSITDNVCTTSNGCGGVKVEGSFTMSGGEISGNTAQTAFYGGGVHVAYSGSFTISGDASITGNTSGGSSCNVYLDNNTVITIDGGLTGSNTIGVSMENPGVFTSGGGATYIEKFTSDDSNLDVQISGNELCLSSGFTVGFDLGGATGTPPTNQEVENGGKATEPTAPTWDDHAFAGWYNGDTLWNFDTVVTGNMILTAKWITFPTVTVTGDTSMTYGAGGTLTANFTQVSGHTYTYQWYSNTTNSNTGGTIIEGAVSSIYTIPNTTNRGTYYYYCAVTASIDGSSATASVTSPDVTVTVSEKGYDSSFTISDIADQTYTGSQITPDVTVRFGSTTLIKGTDYDLSYGNNTSAGTGTGTVTITFKGNYSGETGKTFNIVYAGLSNDKTLSDYVTIPQANDNGWYNQDITLTPKDGVSIGTTDAATDGVTIATEGEHTQTVFIKDSEGHIYETEITYKLDKTDPTVSNVNKPAEDAVWTDENVTVSFDVSDETSGIQTVTVTDKDGKSVTVTPGSEGKYNFTATENGTYTVTVTDNAGNQTVETIDIKNIDKTAPTLFVSGGMESAEELTLTVSASNTGGSDIQSVTVQKDGGEPANIEDDSYTITAPGTYTFTATTGAGVTSTVTKTVHSVTIGTDAQLVVDGGNVTKPADPTKTGYTFDRWMNGQNEWDFDQDTVTADLTLTAKWTLDAPTVTLTASDDNVTYGEKITLTAAATHAASVTYAYEWYKDGDKLDGNADSTLTLTKVDDSGSYTVKVTASDGSQSKTVESSAVSVTITKATPDYTVPSGLTATYGDRLSSIELPNDWAWDDDSALVGNAGERSHSATFTPTDTANYNSVEQNITVQVDKATLTPSVASVQNKVYDGDMDTEGTITLTDAVLNENPTASGVFTFEDANADENKTVNVTVTLDDDWGENYQLSTSELTATANITPKTVGLTWSGYENLVYDGEPVGVTAAATGLVSGDQCAVTVENGDKTDAGTYTAKATGLDNPNYQLPDTGTTQSYTIAPRPVKLSWSESSFTYDGSEKTVTATIENLVSGDIYALTYSGNAETEHGSYTAEVTALGNDNYTLTNGAGLTHSWSIGKAVVSFTVSGNSHTYNGEPKTAVVTQDAGQTQIPAGGYEVKYGGEASQTAAGTYDITVTITNGNFCFEDGETSKVVGQLTITAADVPIPEADETAFIYNGAEQTYHIAESGLYAVSGNVQVDAGTYTVTVALKDKANYTWSDGTTDDRTYTFTISPKAVTATWVGLEQVYGSVEPVSVVLSGLAEGDEGIEAVISGVSTEAGDHPLNASLKNYDIINGTATLRIQQKPVTITVTDNAVTVGSEPAISAPGLAESDYEVIYKDKNGNEVTPSEPGTYEVWVEITNPNYRHPDGSSEKQVGSVVVSSGTPRTYEVSFAGSGAGGSTAGMKAAGGSVITLPECGFTKPGSVFTGWKYFNVVYKPGDSFTMPSGDVTFTAQWAQSQSVGGKVQDKGGAPVEGAAVSIWQGSNKLDEDVTGSNGAYSFPDLAPGSYNVSVSTGEKTVTTVVTVDENGQVTGGNIVLPEGNTSTRVEITPGSPDLVVGELDRVFDNTDGEDYTAADAETVKNGGMVEITFTADEKKLAEVRDELQQLQSASDVNLSLFLDCTLEKEVYDSNGTKDESASGFISRSSVLLEVRLPLPTEMQGKYGYSVSRIHEGEAQALSTSANSLGEYFEVSADKSALILHVCCFSIYAVGYENSPVLPPLPTENAPNVSESEHGSVTVFPNLPTTGTVVTITPKPDEGYTLDKLTVTDASGKPVELSPNGDGTYSFTQPSGAVIITVTFKVLTDVSECPRDASCPMSGYTDLNMGEWYHDGIHYCLDEGLMDGVDAGMFAPNATTSRAMIVTMLWRLQGSPEVEAEETFTDVAPGDWYADAIAWAAAEGVAEGYEDGSFRPNDAITREQLAAMLWRYAGSPEADGDLSVFADGADTSSWAEQAMSWAVAQGLLTGVDNDRLAPGGQATRAQTATILMRFAQSETK